MADNDNNIITTSSVCRRAINFDLDTKQMKKELGDKTSGYGLLKKSLKKAGFIHKQGSGYVSKEPLSEKDVYDVLKLVSKQNPWLATCLNEMDITEIRDVFEVAPFVIAESNKQKLKDKRKKTASTKDALSKGSGKTPPTANTTSNKSVSNAQNQAIAKTTQKNAVKSTHKGMGL